MNKINPYLILLIRCLLGLVFVYASYDKILDPGKFARDIANYHIGLIFPKEIGALSLFELFEV